MYATLAKVERHKLAWKKWPPAPVPQWCQDYDDIISPTFASPMSARRQNHTEPSLPLWCIAMPHSDVRYVPAPFFAFCHLTALFVERRREMPLKKLYGRIPQPRRDRLYCHSHRPAVITPIMSTSVGTVQSQGRSAQASASCWCIYAEAHCLGVKPSREVSQS